MHDSEDHAGDDHEHEVDVKVPCGALCGYVEKPANKVGKISGSVKSIRNSAPKGWPKEEEGEHGDQHDVDANGGKADRPTRTVLALVLALG